MKKFIVSFLIIAYILSLAGCSNNESKKSEDNKKEWKEDSKSEDKSEADSEDAFNDIEKDIYNKGDSNSLKQGQIVEFGNYEQDADLTNGKEPIEWIVLSVDEEENKALLLSKYALDVKAYNESKGDVTWQACTLRAWLNGTFYYDAFSDSDKTYIVQTDLKNPDNQITHTSGGNDTKDNVFILSLDDVINTDYGFNSAIDELDIFRRCAPTKYVTTIDDSYWNKNAYEGNDGFTEDFYASCEWWLRTPGTNQSNACFVYFSGKIKTDEVYDYRRTVRPSVYVNIDAVGKAVKIKNAIHNGQIVKFGDYEQDNNLSNGKEPIEWIVLSVNEDEGKVLLLSKYVLVEKIFEEKENYKEIQSKMGNEEAEFTWSNCTLREWLNNDFYNEAFSDKEKNLIKKTTLKNSYSIIEKEYDEKTDQTNTINEDVNQFETEDIVFLLSKDEVIDIFENYTCNNMSNAQTTRTSYALLSSAHNMKQYASANFTWGLRSTGKIKSTYYYENGEIENRLSHNIGCVSTYGYSFYTLSNLESGIRPAIYVDLKNDFIIESNNERISKENKHKDLLQEIERNYKEEHQNNNNAVMTSPPEREEAAPTEEPRW